MSNVYVIALNGIENANSLEDLPEKVRAAAVRAVNRAAEKARTLSARAMRTQVNFPAQYLNPASDRLVVSKKAAGLNLRATVSGQVRPTSLARFLVGTPVRGENVKVQVKPGHQVEFENAFVINLRRGNADSRGNLGLAVRTDGNPPRGAYKPKQIAPNLWLLYGPSVDQVFKSVRGQVAPDVEDFLTTEFNRLVEL